MSEKKKNFGINFLKGIFSSKESSVSSEGNPSGQSGVDAKEKQKRAETEYYEEKNRQEKIKENSEKITLLFDMEEEIGRYSFQNEILEGGLRQGVLQRLFKLLRSMVYLDSKSSESSERLREEVAELLSFIDSYMKSTSKKSKEGQENSE